MKIRGLVVEDFLQYKEPSLFIISSYCDFKCEKEANCPGMCQNSSLMQNAIIDLSDDKIVSYYVSNDITKSIVFGGLEPFEQKEEVIKLISKFREVTKDPIIIYTGYREEEVVEIVNELKHFGNIFIKFGRYIPNQHSHLDPVLGVELASDNQYAKEIS